MKTNINEFIFTRTQPLKKIAVINSLKDDELLATSKATVNRIVRECGRRVYKTLDKDLYISRDRRAGNNWNSTIEKVSIHKNVLWVCLYLQYASTDTTVVESYDEFFRMRAYHGSVERDDYRGNPRTYYFEYSVDEKAEVIRSILLEYVYTKYHDKLKREGVV